VLGIPVFVGAESVSELGDTLESLQGGVEVASVSKVLKASRRSARDLSGLSFSHVFEETDLLSRTVDLRSGVARGSAHHHELLTGLGFQRREGSVILELASLDEDLLAFGFDVGEGVKLVLEGLAGGFGVELDIVLLALMFDDNRDGRHGGFEHAVAVGWRKGYVVEMAAFTKQRR
jgi:hypothetical protein